MKRGKPIDTRVVPDGETALLERIRELVVAAHKTISHGVDLVQVHTNFEIGRHIVEYEQQGEDRAAYGEAVAKNLSQRLTSEFGQGFSLSNIKLMRQFFLQYRDRTDDIGQTASDQFKNAKSQTSSGQFTQSIEVPLLPKIISFSLSWSHYVFLLGIKNPGERSFYEIEATQQNWTIRELKRQFDSSLFERLALSRDKEGIRKLAQEGQLVNLPQDLLKEPLVLEFLGLPEQARFSESDLESAIIGLISKAGRCGGTNAHKDIAFEFASWISVEFKLYLIKEFQRLKKKEQKTLGWDIRRDLTKLNYRIHTEAIREYLIPPELSAAQISLVHASKADVLNMALFGKTAAQWRSENSGEKGNIRDQADSALLVCLSNLENLNALFISEGQSQAERLRRLNQIAIQQMKILADDGRLPRLDASKAGSDA
jgi:hypothetical protein